MGFILRRRHQVEDLLAKYKQSEIERFEIEAKNKLDMEAKDREIEKQAKELLHKQRNDEALLQQYQNELQELREQLSEEKSSVRTQLIEQLEKLFVKMKNSKHDLTDAAKKDIDKQRKRLNKQLKREWSKLDQYEMKLIEVEAEKRKIIQDAEERLKQERSKSENERNRRLDEVEKQRKSLQEILENHLQEREVARKEFEQTQKEVGHCSDKLEDNLDVFRKKLTKLEWLQYKLCTDQLDSEDKTDEISEIMLKIKTVSKDIEILERQNDKNNERLRMSEEKVQEKEENLEACEAKVEQSLAEMADVRDRLVECQQRFGEEFGDVVNIVTLERDADLAKIEKDRELLMSKHLEHQSALEVLVNENLESSDDDDENVEVKEIKTHVAQLVRSVSPGLEDESLPSQITEKKVQIHYQQVEAGKNEQERKKLQAHEQKFLAFSREVQTERQNELKVLQEKINALQGMVDNEGATTRETANYYESETSNLMRVQRRIFDVDKELAEKMKERREIEGELEQVKRQMELQAESNQEQFREMLEKLKQRGMEIDSDIADIKEILRTESEDYLKRLR